VPKGPSRSKKAAGKPNAARSAKKARATKVKKAPSKKGASKKGASKKGASKKGASKKGASKKGASTAGTTANDYGRRADYGASVDDFVAQLPPEKRDIVNELRDIVREAVPGVAESIRWGMPVFARKKIICYASPKSDYVRFGFYARIELEDPDDRVSGLLAYVKLQDVKEIERPVLHDWIKQVVERTGA
jgi:hypothetical protein